MNLALGTGIATGAAEWLLEAGVESACVGLVLVAVVAAGRRWPAPLRSALMGLALLGFALPLVPDAWRWAVPSWTPAPNASGLAASVPTSWLLTGFGLWVLGGFGHLARLLLARRRVRRDLALAEAPLGEPVAAEVRRAAAALKVAPPSVSVSSRARSPFIARALRPTLIVPRAWAQVVSADQMRLALLHELAHVKRGDLLWTELAAWLSTVWWWHPVFWLVVSRRRAASEDACDDLALMAGRRERRGYCEMLLRWASREPPGAATAAFEPVSVGMHAVERRVRRLMHPTTRHHGRLSALHRVGVALAVALLWTVFGSTHPGDGHSGHHSAHHSHHSPHGLR